MPVAPLDSVNNPACAGIAHDANMTSWGTGKLSPVQDDGVRRLQLTWANASKNRIGKFSTKQEAEKWIAAHRLLTERLVEDR